MLGEYIPIISLVISISVVMVISPGQDFAIITRNSLLYSRKSGIIGAFGIFRAVVQRFHYFAGRKISSLILALTIKNFKVKTV